MLKIVKGSIFDAFITTSNKYRFISTNICPCGLCKNSEYLKVENAKLYPFALRTFRKHLYLEVHSTCKAFYLPIYKHGTQKHSEFLPRSKKSSFNLSSEHPGQYNKLTPSPGHPPFGWTQKLCFKFFNEEPAANLKWRTWPDQINVTRIVIACSV